MGIVLNIIKTAEKKMQKDGGNGFLKNLIKRNRVVKKLGDFEDDTGLKIGINEIAEKLGQYGVSNRTPASQKYKNSMIRPPRTGRSAMGVPRGKKVK